MPRRKKEHTVDSTKKISNISVVSNKKKSDNIVNNSEVTTANIDTKSNNIDDNVSKTNLSTEEPIKVKKKRGRKPKPKPENYEPPKPKKRGRKPKDKFKFDDLTTNKFEPDKTEDKNFIIKLPISCKELDNEFKLTKKLTYNPDISEPKGVYNNLINNFYCYDKDIIPQNLIPNNNEIQNDTLNESQNIIQYDMMHDRNYNNNMDNTMIINRNFESLNQQSIKKNKKHNISTKEFKTDSYNKRIDNLLEDIIEDENKKELTQIEKLLNKKYKQTKQIHLLHSICITTQNNEWMRMTNISCFWCCHKFNHTPWGIPVKYDFHKNIFSLFGIFCSPNCALSHLLQNEKNSTTLWEKVSLLNLLHYKIYNIDENIVPAPDKISLKEFGGPLTIEQFRCLTLKNNKNYSVNFPPCAMISPVLEETKRAFNQDSFFIPIDKNKINQIQTNLKIKRTKSINTNKNTLDNVIQINYK